MPPTRRLRAASFALLLACLLAWPAAAAVTPNGRLQIIHLDVGQGDGALLISPLGQVVLIDEGPSGVTPAMGVSVVNQLLALGVTHVDYHFASHYHADHIGNMGAIAAAGITFGYGWDRGGSYTTGTYTTYVSTLGSKRRTLVKGQVIMLDSLSAHPVTITCVDLNGAGVVTTDENTLCTVLKVKYGEYDELFGGDIGGANSGSYHDIESIVAPSIGQIEVYKVHHHGSATSSNATLLAAIQPKLGVISCGNGNSYGHPTAAAVGRLHTANVKTYWTETGTGATPLAGWDKVSNGQIVISATWEPAGVDTVRGNGFTDTFINSGTPVSDGIAPVATLMSPDGGEAWKAGSSHSIAWTATDNVGVTTVDLAWSADGGAVWTPVASGISNSGAYAWTVPSLGTTAGRVRVRARDAAGNLGADSSLTSFVIDFWTLATSAGAGGTITPGGVVQAVQGASQSFAIAPAAGCQIADVLVDGVSVGAVTTYPFTNVIAHHTIAAAFLDLTAPLVTLTAPVGGERWPQASLHDITWTATDNVGVDSVNVDYSITGPAGPWLSIAHGLANSGTFPWTLPGIDSDSAMVRVTAFDHGLNATSDRSDSLFRIGTSVTAADLGGPAVLALARPAPNPSAGAAQMRFSLPREGHVRLEIIDLSGRRLWQSAGVMTAGSHQLAWDGRASDGGSVGAGLYFVRLVTPWGERTERLVRLH